MAVCAQDICVLRWSRLKLQQESSVSLVFSTTLTVWNDINKQHGEETGKKSAVVFWSQ